MSIKEMEKLFGKHKRLRFVSIGEYESFYVSDEWWSAAQCKAERDAVYFQLQQAMS